MTRALQVIPGMQAEQAPPVAEEKEFVTLRIAGQLFALPVALVSDVLRGLSVSRVPLAPDYVRGAMNLRGRVVLVIDMRVYLGLPASREEDRRVMSVGVEYKGEEFSLIVDSVGEVVSLAPAQIEPCPANLSGAWRAIAAGVYKYEDELMMILDLRKLLTPQTSKENV